MSSGGEDTAVFGIVLVIVAPFTFIFTFLLIQQTLKMKDVKSVWSFICLYYYASWDQIKNSIGPNVTDEELFRWISMQEFHYKDSKLRYRQTSSRCPCMTSAEHSETARIDTLGNVDGFTFGAGADVPLVTRSYSQQNYSTDS